MARALALAASVAGRTRPNPPVGAVVVRDGVTVGEGATMPAGGPHAEVTALSEAGDAARGGTLYTTLEPCCHHGRTPPCTDAVLRAGITHVIVATRDPNPLVDGGGVARLRDAGVAVEVGDGEEQARQLYAPFAHWVTSGRPFVTAKYAMTLDGRIATRTGHSRWVSGPEARRLAHRWRDTHDAILVGVGTVIADDPSLTTRLGNTEREPHHPLRIVLDSGGRAPLGARLFDPALPGETWVATTNRMSTDHAAALFERGVTVLTLPEDPDGRVALPALLDALGERERTSLLVEGGSAVLGAFFAARLVQRLRVFIAPKIVGGARAPGPIGDPGIATMDGAIAIEGAGMDTVGADWLIRAELYDPWPPHERTRDECSPVSSKSWAASAR